MGDRVRIGMSRCLNRCTSLFRIRATAILAVPGRQIITFWQSQKEPFHIWVSLGVEQHRIIHIPGFLLPGIEHHLFIGVIGVQRRHYSLCRIVKQNRRYPRHHHLRLILIQMGRAKERFVLFNGLAFIIKNRPTVAHPAEISQYRFGFTILQNELSRTIWIRSIGFPLRCLSRFRLNLFLYLPPKAIGVAETHLHLRLRPRCQIADVGFTGDRRRHHRLTFRPELLQIINNPRRRIPQQRCRHLQRIRQKGINLRLGQIGLKVSRQAIAQPRHIRRLTHHRRPRHHPQCIKHRFHLVAIRISNLPRLHHPIVIANLHHILLAIGQRIPCFHHK